MSTVKIDTVINRMRTLLHATPGGEIQVSKDLKFLRVGFRSNRGMSGVFDWHEVITDPTELRALMDLAVFARVYLPEISVYLRKVHGAFEAMGINPDELYQQAVDDSHDEQQARNNQCTP